MLFLAVFGTVLIIQFLCMIVHRLATWMHVLARAPLTRNSSSYATWSFSNRKLPDPSRNPAEVMEDSVYVEALRERGWVNEQMRRRYLDDVCRQSQRRSRLSTVTEEDERPLLRGSEIV